MSKQIELTIKVDEDKMEGWLNPEDFGYSSIDFNIMVVKAYKAQRPSPMEECLDELISLPITSRIDTYFKPILAKHWPKADS